jgi:hypothetical protein
MGSSSVFTFLAAVDQPGGGGPAIFGIPVEFALFAVTLLGVALFHRRTLILALDRAHGDNALEAALWVD